MDIQQIPTAIILQDIAKFQNAQKRYAPSTHTHQQCSVQLAPLFAEMARRQKEGTK
jgi:hypothetical protein